MSVGVAVSVAVSVGVFVGVTDAVSVIYKIPSDASYVAVAAAGSPLRPTISGVFVIVAVGVFVGVAVSVGVKVAVFVGVFDDVAVGVAVAKSTVIVPSALCP